MRDMLLLAAGGGLATAATSSLTGREMCVRMARGPSKAMQGDAERNEVAAAEEVARVALARADTTDLHATLKEIQLDATAIALATAEAEGLSPAFYPAPSSKNRFPPPLPHLPPKTASPPPFPLPLKYVACSEVCTNTASKLLFMATGAAPAPATSLVSPPHRMQRELVGQLQEALLAREAAEAAQRGQQRALAASRTLGAFRQAIKERLAGAFSAWVRALLALAVTAA